MDAASQAILLQELPERVRGGREPIGHRHPKLRQRPQHFAQRGVLAAYAGDIAATDLAESKYVLNHAVQVSSSRTET